MKISECKSKFCDKIQRRYNDSCQQFCGPFYCMFTKTNLKEMKECPLESKKQ